VRIPYNAHTTRYPERVQAETSQYGGARPDKWRPNPLGARPRDVIEVPVLANGTQEKTDHPTQKPVQLIRKFVLASSDPGDLVVDPFAGSGTTPVVCELTGRRWAATEDSRLVAGSAGAGSLQRSRFQSHQPRGAIHGHLASRARQFVCDCHAAERRLGVSSRLPVLLLGRDGHKAEHSAPGFE